MKAPVRICGVTETMKDCFESFPEALLKFSKTLLKSFLRNCLRHSLLNFLWITSLICYLGQSPSPEPLTDSPSLRPLRLRKFSTNFSPKGIFAQLHPHGLLPQTRMERYCFALFQNYKQPNCSKLLFYCTR